MNVEIVELPEIAIIGKEGFCTREKNLAAELWSRANASFGEVAGLGMRERDGSFVGFWGAMSDEERRFLPWTDGFTRGLYLAGLEVYNNTPVPEGWTRWILPARTYLVTDVQQDRYAEIFREVLTKVLPERQLELCGAVCDYIKPSTGQNRLFFPVRPMKEEEG